MAVSVQQASINAFVTYLKSALSSDIIISGEWPNPDVRLPPKAITILKAGSTVDLRFEKNIQQTGNVGSTQVGVLVRLWQRQQPLQLDVWALSDLERDDILAQLDIALNAGSTVGALGLPDHGCIVQVGDSYPDGTYADFTFESPSIDDSPESVRASEYRATYRGDLYVMFSAPATVARQRLINFQATLAAGDVQTTPVS